MAGTLEKSPEPLAQDYWNQCNALQPYANAAQVLSHPTGLTSPRRPYKEPYIPAKVDGWLVATEET